MNRKIESSIQISEGKNNLRKLAKPIFLLDFCHRISRAQRTVLQLIH